MKLTIPMLDDFHIHLRNDERSNTTCPLLRAGGVARGLAMPNTAPKAIETAEDWAEYKAFLQSIEPNFDYVGSIKLTPRTTKEMVQAAAADPSLFIGKQYPTGVTTNSDDGVSDVTAMYEVYGYMEEAGLVLSMHGEVPKVSVLEAESRFLPTLRQLAKDFPNLKMVMEHVSTAEAVETIKELGPNVAATITPQHLLMTIHDVLGSNLKPHNYCMPIVKTEEDRRALVEVIRSGHPNFFFGSDSAPHLKTKKEKNHGMPGVYTSPIIVQLLALVFDREGMMDKLEDFTSKFGAAFYGVPRNTETITLTNEVPYEVPAEFGGVVPLKAGAKLPWSIV